MAKLYFRYGAVSSTKTMNLLAVVHNYRVQEKPVVLLKPALDTRFGEDEVKSRAGLQQKADYLIYPETNILKLFRGMGTSCELFCVLVDEAQFLDSAQIDQLRMLTVSWNIPVICYGLRTDFRTQLFPGSKRLMEVADSIEEVKTTCFYCNHKATFNLKHVNGKADTSGPVVQLGAEEKYYPCCFMCYAGSCNEVGQSPVASWTVRREPVVDGDADDDGDAEN
jgi:thymidine kinase